jgi:hypothetical protein
MTSHEPQALAPQWAFVVQLRLGTLFDAASLRGRIEHVVSGQSSLFDSLEEMRAFMEQVLAVQAGD